MAPGWEVHAAKYNGDNRSDRLLYNRLTGAFAECVSAPQPGNFVCASGTWAPDLQIALVAGSTRDDELLYQPENGAWRLVTHRNDGVAAITGRWAPNLQIVTGDLDGDGRTDLFIYDPVSGAFGTTALK
jgi:hypothetical protein